MRLNVESRGNEALMREKTAELLAFLDSLGAVKNQPPTEWGHSSFASKWGQTSFEFARGQSDDHQPLALVAVCAFSRPLAASAAPYDIPAAVASSRQGADHRRTRCEAPIRFLASDALEGRGPATRGDALARLYLAAELSRWAI